MAAKFYLKDGSVVDHASDLDDVLARHKDGIWNIRINHRWEYTNSTFAKAYIKKGYNTFCIHCGVPSASESCRSCVDRIGDILFRVRSKR